MTARAAITTSLIVTPPAATPAIVSRLVEFAALCPGWFDGEHGESFAKRDLDWLASAWAARMPRSLDDARLAPNPEGEISAEWLRGRWDATLDIDLKNRTGFLHALELDTHEELVLDDLDLTDPAAWTEVAHLLGTLAERSSHG